MEVTWDFLGLSAIVREELAKVPQDERDVAAWYSLGVLTVLADREQTTFSEPAI